MIDDPQTLLHWSRSFRACDLHDEALWFAIDGVKITSRDDPLYYPMKAEIATSGYYSEEPEMRELGHAACEELVLARDCHPAARHVAFQDLFHYTKRLTDYAPSFHAERVKFDVPPGYYPTNPSICRLHDQMFMNVRCVNYYTDAGEKVILPTEELLGTRNFLLCVDRDISRHSVHGEVLAPQDLPRLNKDMPVGIEDIRLFPRHEYLWASGTVVQTNTEKMAEIMVARIDHNLGMDRWRICNVAPWRHQKNWAPIIDTRRSSGAPRFVYSYDPHHICEDGLSLGTPQPPIAAHTWSGSTQAIPWNDGHLVMIHEKMYYPEMKYTRRWYQQRFVFYDKGWNLRKISRRFQFDNGETEFPCGMCVHPDGQRFVISYGVLDREAWLATVNVDEVEGMLYDVGVS